jgi:cobalt-zinc-cadmium resistance protein CzcA
MKYYIFSLAVFWAHLLAAQQPVSIDDAIRIALENNAKLRTESKWVEYQQALINTGKIVGNTEFTAELGQFNSAFFDTGFGVSQSFQWPGVYKKKTHANYLKVKSAEAYYKLSEMDIRQQLDELFAEYRYLERKTSLLMFQDSLYTSFQQKAALRWQKGETDILEKTTADQQKINIAQQLATVDKMKQYILLSIDWILNDGKQYVPKESQFEILSYNIFFDSLNTARHPSLMAAAQELAASKAATQVEKSMLLPDLSIGYRNVGIRGTGADNIVYGAGDRFNSVQIGVGIPLFRKGIQSAIQGAQILEEVKNREYNARMRDIHSRIRQSFALYNETMNQIQIFEQESLNNALTIRKVSNEKFTQGEINYLEFVMLNNQAIQIESDYLELIRNVNAHIIDLYYLTNNF